MSRVKTARTKIAGSKPAAWWALSNTRAKFTAVGAAALVLGLLTTSVIVWTSPTNPVSQAIHVVSAKELAAKKVVYQRDALLDKVSDLQRQLANMKSSNTATKTQMAAIQQQLWSTQGALDAANAASAARAASAAAAKSAPKKTSVKTTVTAAGVTAPSKEAILTPTARYFGLFTDQAPFNWASYNATALKIGKTPNSVGYFGGWDQTYRGDVVTAAWKRNTLPVLTWESRPIQAANDEVDAPAYSLPNIIRGDFDTYLHQYAKDIVATGLPLGIRLDHEMNGTWYPWAETDAAGASINGNNVGDYAKMWQHVHDIFQAEGANSLVAWIWAPNITNNLSANHKSQAFLASLYPGDAYVDEVGLSGYLRPTYKPENDFSFNYTFGASLTALRTLTDKPIYLAEIGASETGGHKVAWINSLFAALGDPANNDIVGFSWFNQAVTSYTEGELATNDWRIESRPDSLAAFSAGIALPADNFSTLVTP
ncbi:hypothetical protein BH09ACT1_BH09ACT1_16150 [soil metagenome]